MTSMKSRNFGILGIYGILEFWNRGDLRALGILESWNLGNLGKLGDFGF